MVGTTQYRDAITHFAQGPDEPFHVAWERFRDLLRKCPHHDMPKWQLVNFFHKGLNEAQSPTHHVSICPSAALHSGISQEQVNAAYGTPGGNNMYSNTYNPAWRNHPNFSWRNLATGTSAPPPQVPQVQGNFQSPFQTSNPQGFTPMNAFSQPQKFLSMLEAMMAKQRENGKLPSQPVANPRGVRIIDDITGQEVRHEQVQAITTLRSGKRVENKVEEDEAKKDEKWKKILEENKEHNEKAQEEPPTTEPSPEQRHALVPFPQRLQETSKATKQASKLQDIMEMFKQVKINLPLLDAIQQIPVYAKFLKDMCTQKRRSSGHVPKKVLLAEQVSSIIQQCTAPKFKDPDAPTISCIIGNHQVERALLDLRASVNLLPYSVYLQLGLGELKPTSIILQLADRSTKQPHSVIEDVIIKVDKFYFLVDFIVLDTEPVPESRGHILVILGRPFLATANASINCRNGVMDLSFGNMKVRLNIFNASNCPLYDKDCFLIDSIDKCVEEMAPFALTKDPLEACLSYFDNESFDIDKSTEEVNVILDGANMLNIPP
ncbi:uncharacterized protein LOC132269694 [Cornus florida]|uniref:uncharacterized protein LOC132269694 n=1 Tax=Cornus florida TaxID=4283 RepID=UPI0028A003B9|nr:uncharacterized protein LOC132269694 [Cornus florida]